MSQLDYIFSSASQMNPETATTETTAATRSSSALIANSSSQRKKDTVQGIQRLAYDSDVVLVDELEDESAEGLINQFIMIICQIICFPFAIDANEEVTSRIFKIIKEFNLLNKILSACMANEIALTCDIPMSLIARLVLTDEDLVQLMIDQLNNSKEVS